MKQPHSTGLFLLIIASMSVTGLGGCTDGRPSGTDAGRFDAAATDSGGGGGCSGCGADEVCVAGACMPLPSSCPCPQEAYCDLATDMCVAGCTSDDRCDAGRICDVGTRTCSAGCRMDTQCGAGQICEALSCQTGCRMDTECGAGEVCDGVTCRTGCNSDSECTGPGQLCDESARACRDGCREHVDCGMGEICDFGSETCIAGCLDDGGCGTGEICERAVCVEGCRAPADCGSMVCTSDRCQAPVCGDRVVNQPDEVCDGTAPEGSCRDINERYSGTARCTSSCRLTNTGCCIRSGYSCATGPTALPCCGSGCGFGGAGRC